MPENPRSGFLNLLSPAEKAGGKLLNVGGKLLNVGGKLLNVGGELRRYRAVNPSPVML